MAETFNITREILNSGQVALFAVQGSINVHTFDQLESAISQAFSDGICNIILELSEVKYISSAGAGVLMNAFLQAQEQKGDLVLVNMSNGVRDVIDLLNLREVLHSAPDVTTALDMLAEHSRKASL